MRVARRRVYYISGFDPRGARFYHQLCQTEAAQQQSVNGCQYKVGGRRNDGAHVTRWQVTAEVPGHDGTTTTTTEWLFLRWDDLIREHWPASRAAVLAGLPGFYWHFLTGGVLRRTWASGARAIFWIFLLPLLYLLLSLALAGGLGLGLAALLMRLGPAVPLAATAGLLAATVLLWAALRQADEARLFWLSRIHVFMLHWGRHGPEPFATRWAAFAQRIADDLAADTPDAAPDEVLIVGHSVGAVAAVAVAERWLALQQAGPSHHGPLPSVRLLTLGQVIPMLGLIPQADWFRAQLQHVAASSLPWLDISAPSDPLCYGLVDPVTACGLPPVARPGYRVRSARFDRMFDAGEYAQLRRDLFRIHFQYLMATRHPVDNDLFSLTCGPAPLATNPRSSDAP